MKAGLRKLTELLTFSLGAGNTKHGLGRDTEMVGETIQKEADRHMHSDQPAGHNRAPS